MAIFVHIVHIFIGVFDFFGIVRHRFQSLTKYIIRWISTHLNQDNSGHHSYIIQINFKMSRRYDSKTTTFTPDGRLQQIEYAVQAINKTGSSIGIVTREGIVLATEKHESSFLLEESKISEKIYAIDKHIYAVVSGLSADANYLINLLREYAQDYKIKFRTNVPVQEIVVYICDIKQYYTQIGGSRPFGAAFLFAGYDKNGKFQLYSTDPAGNYAGWKATAIGSNQSAANSFLKQQYKQSMSLDEGYGFALKSLVKTMETTTPSAKKIELVSISFNMSEQIQGITISEERIKELLQSNGLTSEEKEKKEQQKKGGMSAQ